MAEQHLTKERVGDYGGNVGAGRSTYCFRDYQSIWGQGMEEQFYSSHGECLLEKGFLEVAGFKKTTKNYARTFKPTMTKEKYFVRKVMGNTPVAEKKKIYMQLLKEVNEIETLDTIKEEIYARKKELENR